MVNFCVVVPVYNEADHLQSLIGSLNNHLSCGQIIIVDDGSSDGTPRILKKSPVISVIQDKNHGKGYALRKGFNKALEIGFDWILTMDGDMQHNPDDIASFTTRAQEGGCDIILGSRMADISTMPYQRIISNTLASLLITLRTGQKIKDSQCGYRMIHRRVLENISLNNDGYMMESELLIKAGLKDFIIDSVPVQTIYNESKSAIKPVKDSLLFLIVILSSFFWSK
ncbi:glycosyltransferase family 2 protein [candidate division KSB1 bacterium]